MAAQDAPAGASTETSLELFEDNGPDGLELLVGENRLRPVGPDVWCRACGSIHETGRCQGEVQITGHERHAWRGVFETPAGRREAHGVLVAPAGGRWRARILTYPRVLWTIPGTDTTLKFVADDPLEAERRAIDYLNEHCRRLGHKRLANEQATVAVEEFDPEMEVVKDDTAKARSRRRVGSLPIRFGTEKPCHQGITADLSETGLFIVTAERLPPGTKLQMLFDIGARRMRLSGVVRWMRTTSAPGRSRGLGVEILHAPALYVDYVRHLA